MADAVVVSGVAEAAAALAHLKDADGGRAGPAGDRRPPARPAGRLAGAARTAPAGPSTSSRPRPSCSPRWPGRWSGWPWCPTSTPPSRWSRTHPRVRAVTAAGDLVGADWAVGGQSEAPSNLVVRARVDEAEGELTGAIARAAELADRLAAAREVGAAPAPPTSTPRSPRGRPPTARRSAVAAELAELGAAARSAAAEAERHLAARVRAEQALEQVQGSLAGLEQRLADAEAAPVEEEPSTEARDRLRAEVAAARQAETEARLAVRTAEERARALHGRAESLRRQARQERAARERAAAARVARERGAAVAARVRVATPRRRSPRSRPRVARAAAERDELALGPHRVRGRAARRPRPGPRRRRRTSTG